MVFATFFGWFRFLAVHKTCVRDLFFVIVTTFWNRVGGLQVFERRGMHFPKRGLAF